MFESLCIQIGSGKNSEDIDEQHIRISITIKWQSGRDFPRGAMRNGLMDGTKFQFEEKKGYLFLLLCIANTTEDCQTLQKSFRIWKNKME